MQDFGGQSLWLLWFDASLDAQSPHYPSLDAISLPKLSVWKLTQLLDD